MAYRSRLLQILLLFSETRPAVTAEEIATALGITLSTTYRDLQKLREAGLVEHAGKDRYILGGHISMLDRIARVTDPLLGASRSEMQRLSAATGLTVTLTRLFGDTVIGVGHVDGNRKLSIGYERGQLVPLFRGCTGKVILGALPWRRLKRIYEANSTDPDVKGLGEDWQQFLKSARSFGQDEFLWTRGEVNPDNLAIATVLTGEGNGPLGSLTIIIRQEEEASIDLDMIERELVTTRRTVETRLAETGRQIPDLYPWLEP